MTTHDASIRSTAAEDIPVVAPQGELDYQNVQPLAGRLHAAARSSPAVILDAQDITFGDSSFLRVLVSVHKECDLRIAGPRPALRQLLELVGMDRIMRVFPSVEAARSAPLAPAEPA